MNIKEQPPAAITSRITQAQISGGFALYVDLLNGNVQFQKGLHTDCLGYFRGGDAISAVDRELRSVKDEMWPR